MKLLYECTKPTNVYIIGGTTNNKCSAELMDDYIEIGIWVKNRESVPVLNSDGQLTVVDEEELATLTIESYSVEFVKLTQFVGKISLSVYYSSDCTHWENIDDQLTWKGNYINGYGSKDDDTCYIDYRVVISNDANMSLIKDVDELRDSSFYIKKHPDWNKHFK